MLSFRAWVRVHWCILSCHLSIVLIRIAMVRSSSVSLFSSLLIAVLGRCALRVVSCLLICLFSPRVLIWKGFAMFAPTSVIAGKNLCRKNRLLRICVTVMFAVAHRKWGFSAYFACAEYECRWKTEDYVCSDLDQGSGATICKPCLQEGGRGHE